MKRCCPICGRPAGDSCNLDKEDEGFVICWRGQRYSPPDGLVAGKSVIERNGVAWAYVGEAERDMGAMFKHDTPLEWKTTAVYEYEDVLGNPCVRVTRRECGKDKEFPQQAMGEYQKIPKRFRIKPYGTQGPVTYVVEGEKCVEYMQKLGFNAICFNGGSSGDPSSLTPNPDWVYVLCPDRDGKGVTWMDKVNDHILSLDGKVEWLYANPRDPRWLDTEDGKDLADWIDDGATAEMVAAARGAKRDITFGISKFWGSIPKPDESNAIKMRPGELRTYVAQHAGDFIAWNELTRRVEIDGAVLSEIDAPLSYMDFDDRNIQASKELAIDTLVAVSRRRPYHPVKEYLEKLEGAEILDDDAWTNIAQFTLKPSATELDNTLLRKWLVSAVARIYEPACPADFMHVLVGGQGLGKTHFYKILAGDEWYAEGFMGDPDNKDSYQILHSKWITELGEVDGMTGGKAETAMKNFITRKSDNMRVPYGKNSEDFDRRFVFCATSNSKEGFLRDPTGNRRFVILEIEKPVDIELVKKWRDLIWARARKEYIDGCDWNMTKQEMKDNDTNNRDFMYEDAWTTEVENWLMRHKGLPYVEVAEILKGMEMSSKDMTKPTANRVAAILKTLGWKSKRVSVGRGRRKNVWAFGGDGSQDDE